MSTFVRRRTSHLSRPRRELRRRGRRVQAAVRDDAEAGRGPLRSSLEGSSKTI